MKSFVGWIPGILVMVLTAGCGSDSPGAFPVADGSIDTGAQDGSLLDASEAVGTDSGARDDSGDGPTDSASPDVPSDGRSDGAGGAAIDAGAQDAALDSANVDVIDQSSDASPDVGRDAGQDGVADASDAGMPEAEAGPWTPGDLPHLSLWLEGDVGVASAASHVTSWSDQSGNNNTASQAIASQRPLLVAAALNGHAVLRFDGVATCLSIPDSQSLRWGTGDYAIEIVASFSNAPDAGDGYGMMFGKQITVFPYPGPVLWANYPFVANPTVFATQVQVDQFIVSSANGLNDGLKRVYGARRTGTNLEARINGASAAAATVPSVDVSAAGSFVFIGGQQVANGVVQALNGDVAEIVAVGGTVTGADLAKLEGYLKTKYGL